MHNGPAVKIYYYLSFFFLFTPHRATDHELPIAGRLFSTPGSLWLSEWQFSALPTRTPVRPWHAEGTSTLGPARHPTPCYRSTDRRRPEVTSVLGAAAATTTFWVASQQSHIFDWVFFSTKKIKMSFKYVLYSDKRYHNSVINVLW